MLASTTILRIEPILPMKIKATKSIKQASRREIGRLIVIRMEADMRAARLHHPERHMSGAMSLLIMRCGRAFDTR